MAGLKLIASARPTYDGGLKKLTFAIPSAARKGDLLVVLIVRDGVTDLPAGWTQIDSRGAANVLLDVSAKLVGDNEPATVVFSSATAQELQGQLLVIRGGAINLLKEASADAAFAATMTPAGAASSSMQAINWALCVWSSSGAPVMTPPAGFTTIDSYQTAITAARSLLVAYKVCNVIDAVVPGNAAASVNATGRAFTEVVRDRLPVQPAELYDPVPGNIGLFGRDRRPRSV